MRASSESKLEFSSLFGKLFFIKVQRKKNPQRRNKYEKLCIVYFTHIFLLLFMRSHSCSHFTLGAGNCTTIGASFASTIFFPLFISLHLKASSFFPSQRNQREMNKIESSGLMYAHIIIINNSSWSSSWKIHFVSFLSYISFWVKKNVSKACMFKCGSKWENCSLTINGSSWPEEK